jgi:hypothetical protein
VGTDDGGERREGIMTTIMTTDRVGVRCETRREGVGRVEAGRGEWISTGGEADENEDGVEGPGTVEATTMRFMVDNHGGGTIVGVAGAIRGSAR